ncbi:FAD-binding oxidoreductase [Arthrobacter ginkgonis]|uniref:FAD-binding oxidoreductase n=1 Tax=Arthrobacter ginkgonis TaxID=1630594 RepID=A0ABP7CNV3_9MICC
MTATPTQQYDDRMPSLGAEVIEGLVNIVGRDAVIVDRPLLEDPEHPLKDPYWIPDNHRYSPAAAVLPSSVEEVQGIVALAHEHRIPIWTHSQGRNNGYGGPSPRVRGSLNLSLRRMNRILEINEELAYAVVEPGVRWFDLYDELRRRGSRLMVSIPDLGWGSVVGNSLDNGVTYLPVGQDFGAPCGLEVVLPDGQLLRTGMGAMSGNPSFHIYKRGVGPVLDPLFMQSNLGIVTRMGIWLTPQPEVFAPLTLTIAHEADLPAAIDTIRELKLRNQLRGSPCLYNTLMAATMTGAKDAIAAAAQGIMPDEDIERIARQTGLGRWYVRAALWGNREEIEVQLRSVRAAWERIPGATITVSGHYAPDEYESIESISDRILAGVPNLDVIKHKDEGFAHIGLSPLVPLQGHRVQEVVELIRTITHEQMGLNFKAGILVTGDRSCAVVASINFDRRDPVQAAHAYEVGRTMIREVARLGYTEYRTHLDLMDDVAGLLDFNDHAYRRFCERIKDAVDPRGILSPGRYGIWPGGAGPAGGD